MTGLMYVGYVHNTKTRLVPGAAVVVDAAAVAATVHVLTQK